MLAACRESQRAGRMRSLTVPGDLAQAEVGGAEGVGAGDAVGLSRVSLPGFAGALCGLWATGKRQQAFALKMRWSGAAAPRFSSRAGMPSPSSRVWRSCDAESLPVQVADATDGGLPSGVDQLFAAGGVPVC